MISLKISNVKDFMYQLLKTDTFDNFLLQEAAIRNEAYYSIDGHIHADAFTEEELEEKKLTGFPCLPFSMLKERCFGLIRGKRTPSYFKFIFLLSPDNLAKTLASIQSSYTVSDIRAAYLNVIYQNGILTLTTGISYITFPSDKYTDHEWGQLVRRFFLQHQIPVEDL